MKRINSTQNPTIKHLVKLQNKAYRHEHGKFIAQGYVACMTLINQKYELIDLYVTEQEYHKHNDTLQKFDCTFISDEVLHKISTTKTPSGIIAVFAIPQQSYTPDSNAIVVHTIQDPGNLGTLIRTAAAMNVKNLFIIDGVDPYSPKVIQATAGTIGYVNIITTSWQTFVQEHQNIVTCALVVQQGQAPQKLDISQSILIIGNEGQGLPDNIIQDCTQQMTIPMPGNTESLNAAVAGSIALYIKANQ